MWSNCLCREVGRAPHEQRCTDRTPSYRGQRQIVLWVLGETSATTTGTRPHQSRQQRPPDHEGPSVSPSAGAPQSSGGQVYGGVITRITSAA